MNITSWAWDFDNNGTVDSTEQSPSYTYSNPGIYTVDLTVTGPGGSDTETKVNYITVSLPATENLRWVEKTPITSPSARNCHAMAYDSTRGVAVMFGGWNGSTTFDDTWEWDGTYWMQRNPVNKPPARADHAMAYDSTRGVVVMFGGWSGSGNLDDTWEWDGGNWTQRGPANKPSVRSQHAMVYDSARGVVVMFGGSTYGTPCFDDTWEWDGINWTQKSPASKPPARDDHAMAFDSTRRVVVLFGGHGASAFNDTWEWDGNNWTQRSAATNPSARWDHAMAYDSTYGVVILFGGFISPSIVFDDTWEWNGTDWAQKSPANHPSGRCTYPMIYDSSRGVIVLFGGVGAVFNYFDDTWEYGIFPTGWTDYQVILSSLTDSKHGSIVSDSTGKLHCVWEECISPRWEIYYSSYNGTSWSAPVNISNNPAINSTQPHIAVDANDNIHVVWYESNGFNPRIRYAKYNGTSWSLPVTIDGGAEGRSPVIAIDFSNNLHVAWEVEVPYGIRYAKYNGVSWSLPVDIAGGTDYVRPRISVDGSNHVYVVWECPYSGRLNVYINEWNGSSWTGVQNLTNNGYSHQPDIAADSTGNLYLVYHDDGIEAILYKYRPVGGFWTSATNISNTSDETTNPEVEVGAGGIAHVVWVQKCYGTNWETYYCSGTGSSWANPSNVSRTPGQTNTEYNLSLCIDKFGKLHTVWGDNTPGNYDIFYSTFSSP